jgi:hypothetical protein
MSTLLHAWNRRLRPAVIVLLLLGAAVATSARGADPLVTVGTVTAPGGTTAFGSAEPDGVAHACLNGQHSGANASSTTSGPVQVNDRSCAGGGGQSGTGVTGGGGGSNATGATSGSRSTTSAGTASGTAGAKGASATKLAAWVFASQASGLRIVRVRYLAAQAGMTKRLGVVVTLRDLKGRLVRHAIVSTSRVAGARTTVSGVRSTFTNRLGQARLAVPLSTPMLGKQLLLRITARTPSARALTIGSVRLPRLGPH